MNYQQAINFLYGQHPVFEREGAGAYKPGLDTSRRLAALFGDPQQNYAIIHVTGTNGKGSVSHMLAAMLQSAGYRVGLFTSPHLVDFCERIKVNGVMISHRDVADWVEAYQALHFPGAPSFFELTSTMALAHFAREKVDVAVVEVGLGGRLDSTNIVTPVLSVITNISLDHTDLLGSTLGEIAAEKAGIIKHGVPVVLGEGQEAESRCVIESKAMAMQAPLVIASDDPMVVRAYRHNGELYVDTRNDGTAIHCALAGDYQVANVNTVLAAAQVLRQLGYRLNVAQGLEHVVELTGLMGRWMRLQENPLVVCDSAHNVAGMEYAMRQLASTPAAHIHMVVGFMADKDVTSMLSLMPENATYYFTQVSSPRALKSTELRKLAAALNRHGCGYSTVEKAVKAALAAATPADVVYVGGSMYVLADFLAKWPY